MTFQKQTLLVNLGWKMIYITERIYDLVGTERAAAAAKNCVIVRMAIIKPS